MSIRRTSLRSTVASPASETERATSRPAAVGTTGRCRYRLRLNQSCELTDRVIRRAELAAASVFAPSFAVGVVDLAFRIILAVRSGALADSTTVVGFIYTGLLLLVIIEVYRTVLASLRDSETRRIVRLIIYVGVIAIVRKAIIFRITEYDCELSAFPASSYSIITFGLVALLFAEQAYDGGLMPSDD